MLMQHFRPEQLKAERQRSSLVNQWCVTQMQSVIGNKQKAGSVHVVMGGIHLKKEVPLTLDFYIFGFTSRVSSLRVNVPKLCVRD